MLTKEEFFAEPDHGNWYAKYILIGRDLSAERVINTLNKIYDEDALSDISDGMVKEEANGYTLVTFYKHKGDVEDITFLTSNFGCSGYAEIPWKDDYFILHAKNGVRKDNEGFSAEWDEGMPFKTEDYEVGEVGYVQNAFILITDTASGIKFQSGRGAVSDKDMETIKNFVNEHKRLKEHYYGVEQTHYGVGYRWIFDEETLSKEVYDGDSVPDEDEIDYFPIGGSNSGPSKIVKLDSDEEIKAFLTAPALGPDYDDPALGDIGDYYLSVENDCNSCTDKFVKKFNLTYEGLQQFDDIDEHYANVERMAKFLKKINYPDFNYDDPFSGKNREMRYSELCDIYEKELANAKKHNAVKGKTKLKSKSKAIGR